MDSLLALKEVLDAMIDDDYEEAASKARMLASVLEENGCPSHKHLISQLEKAARHYSSYVDKETDELEDLNFDEDKFANDEAYNPLDDDMDF